MGRLLFIAASVTRDCVVWTGTDRCFFDVIVLSFLWVLGAFAVMMSLIGDLLRAMGSQYAVGRLVVVDA